MTRCTSGGVASVLSYVRVVVGQGGHLSCIPRQAPAGMPASRSPGGGRSTCLRAAEARVTSSELKLRH
jgi:hypothetical protein